MFKYTKTHIISAQNYEEIIRIILDIHKYSNFLPIIQKIEKIQNFGLNHQEVLVILNTKIFDPTFLGHDRFVCTIKVYTQSDSDICIEITSKDPKFLVFECNWHIQKLKICTVQFLLILKLKSRIMDYAVSKIAPHFTQSILDSFLNQMPSHM